MHEPQKLVALACVTGVVLGISSSWARTSREGLDDYRTPAYSIEGDALVRHNGDRYNNRPLYCNQIQAVVLAGDRPFLRLGSDKWLHAQFMLALVRGDKAKWLQDCSDITTRFRPGCVEWSIRDTDWAGLTLRLEAVTSPTGAGMGVRATVTGAQAGDQLIWLCGGASWEKEGVLKKWDLGLPGCAPLLKQGFIPANCKDNRVEIEGDRVLIHPPSAKSKGSPATIRCDVAGRISVADASAWSDPLKLSVGSGRDLPVVCGVVSLQGDGTIHWSVIGADTATMVAPAEVFKEGLHRAETIGQRVTVDTPDSWLNAAIGMACAATDGVYRDGIYTHAGMRWGAPFLGWRTMFGGTVLGWHDRVKRQADICLAQQIQTDDKRDAHANPTRGLSSQADDSRMFGRGRVVFGNPHHYDMQSQFFDQLVHAWRWTGDVQLEKLLRPALELHLEYIKDCFDPDDDGVYESYANTWPTDNQWYNGGGTAEETSYAYTGHNAALEMAKQAGDTVAAEKHSRELNKIRDSFFKSLWIPSKGYVGAYREQGGLGRLHEDPWLYSVFLPIDAGLLDAVQSLQTLQFSEWGLEREKMPYGGDLVWPSNWLPSIWSLREVFPGDNYHLALAYYHAGLADDGWQLLHGTFPRRMLFGPIPGDLGTPNGGVDFNDCSSMFSRTVVEGLFGYAPDYPNNIIRIAPQFPSTWNHAAIKTPDVALRYQSTSATVKLTITPARLAPLDVRLPVRMGKVREVWLNGKPAVLKLLPGVGCGIVQLQIPSCPEAVVEILGDEPLPQYPAITLKARVGDQMILQAANASIIELLDPQGVLTGSALNDGVVTGTVTTNAGHHLLLARVKVSETTQWRLFKIQITDPVAEAARKAKLVEKISPVVRWETLDMDKTLNADVREIFHQQYLSPRSNTCSLRLATNGYSTWQMALKSLETPPIALGQVSRLMESPGQIRTPQGVPFAWSGSSSNIAFTSLWDNWPRCITVPVGRQGEALWFLVCGFTPPMQVRIANAVLRVKYADGQEERLELIPPFNFWSLCPFGNVDYDYERDGFCLPAAPPATIQLGNNCRANLLSWRLRPGINVESVTLEALSQEVVVGLMGVSVMNTGSPPPQQKDKR